MTSFDTKYATAYTRWYRETGREFLTKYAPDRVEMLDGDVERLSALAKVVDEPLPVCFLGNSGVGKSTLLNALVAGRISVLPAGGIGPLTAQATCVQYSADPYFRATYLSAARLHRVVFALERHHEAELRRRGEQVTATADDGLAALSDEDRVEEDIDPSEAVPAEEGAQSSPTDKVDAYARQACLLVFGNQFAQIDLPYLVDALRECLGQERRWGTTSRAEDGPRIDRIRAALAVTKAKDVADQIVERRAGVNLPGFLTELRDHASGFLAPLIRTLDVGWDADFMKNGIVLVDLPGLGIANDEYRTVTAHWIRRARAVVLVVDKSGVAESSAELLRTTGFLTSLLHEGHDPAATPVSLMVAVVKLDLTANDARIAERAMRPDDSRPWINHFEEACDQAIELVRAQVQRELHRLAATGGESTRVDRDGVVARVLETLQVFPVSATEFRKFLSNDEDDRPRIRSLKESRVPVMSLALEALAQERHASGQNRFDATALSAYDRGRGAVQVVTAKWQQGVRAQEEAERLRADLDTFVEPLRKEFLVRQGAFREFLRSTLPVRIEGRVEAAASQAREDLGKYLEKYETVPWQTLRAAIRRGGAYVGARHVDLPNELTLRFEEPVAVVWSKDILTSLRRETAGMGTVYVSMVGEIVNWTKNQGTRVRPVLVEALHEDLKAQTRDLAGVGKEAIDELKAAVKTDLYDKVQEQVRKRCQQFVRDGQDAGPGVKARMIKFLSRDLAPGIVEVAKPTAAQVLTKNYRRVEGEIASLLKNYSNPIELAVVALVESHEEQVRRGDAKARGRVLDEAAAVLAAIPVPGATSTGEARAS